MSTSRATLAAAPDTTEEPRVTTEPPRDYEHILTETRGRVGIIRLNRPEKLNAWSRGMEADVVDQVSRWNEDPGIGAIVLTGEGRAFCSGQDLSTAAGPRPAPRPSDPAIPGYPITRFMRAAKPVVVAINGYAIGVGLTLLLPCDVRIMSTTARVSMRFIRLGILPELGSTRLLGQIVGLGRAQELCLTGRWIEADEALRIGLVTDVVEPDALLDTAIAKADEIANNPTPAAMLIKELFNLNSAEPDLDTVMEREQVRGRIAMSLPDRTEAIAAFEEKREPRFNRPS
jgi:enoyl-CoA hydratase/carnithine racemase